MTPVPSIESVPAAALIAVPSASAANMPVTCSTRSSLRAAPDQAVHQSGADDDLGHVAELLPDERRRRQGVVAE